MENKVNVANFKGLWTNGYYEGNPLDPHGESSYGKNSHMSILYATYLMCIKPYITEKTVALEIGPGRGAWSQCMLNAKELWCLDVLSEEETQFPYESDKVHYVQVQDFLLDELSDAYFKYCFSFGTLCHVPFMGIEEYARHLTYKLKKGANCFWMIADATKYFNATGEHIPESGPGHWYDADLNRTCKMLKNFGYTIVSPDVGTNLRDPIIHFRLY